MIHFENVFEFLLKDVFFVIFDIELFGISQYEKVKNVKNITSMYKFTNFVQSETNSNNDCHKQIISMICFF